MAVGINPILIQEQIEKLQANLLALEATSLTPPAPQGSGKTVAKLQALSEEYKGLQQDLAACIAACVSLLQEISTNYQSTDSTLAVQLGGKGGTSV